MRKSSAEPNLPSKPGSNIGRGLNLGYRLRSSLESGGSSMVGRRGNSRGWEIRLGALHVVVWLGLALGGVFGSYFIGFFSGRYVGFETARAASGVEVPKLAVTDELQEKSPQGMAKIYDQLSSAAVVRQDSEPRDTTGKGVAPQNEPSDTKPLNIASAVVVKRDPLGDREAIFNEDLGGGSVASANNLETEITGTGGEARVLGREGSSITAPKVEEGDSKAKSAPLAPPAQEKTKPAPEAKVTKEIPKEKEKVAIVKRLPKGYFAQVAAPKTRAEAEEVARKLRKSGFPVVVEDNSTGRSPFYRVMVGPESNKVQADRMLGQLKREKYLTGKLFIRQVK